MEETLLISLIVVGIIFIGLCLVFGIALAIVLVVVSIVSIEERRSRRERRSAAKEQLALRGSEAGSDGERGVSRRRASSFERAARQRAFSAAEEHLGVPNSRHIVVTVVNPASRASSPGPGDSPDGGARQRTRSSSRSPRHRSHSPSQERGSGAASSRRPRRSSSRADSDLPLDRWPAPELVATGLEGLEARGRDEEETRSRSRGFALERWVSSTEDTVAPAAACKRMYAVRPPAAALVDINSEGRRRDSDSDSEGDELSEPGLQVKLSRSALQEGRMVHAIASIT